MAVLATNTAQTTLATGITATQTTIPVAAGAGAEFPTPVAPDWFPVTLQNASGTIEYCKCTGRSGDTLTVLRAQEGTAGFAFSAGDKVELRATAALLANKLDKDTGGTVGGALTIDSTLDVVGATTLSGDLTLGGAAVNVPAGGIPITGGTVEFDALTQGGRPVVDVSAVQTLSNKTLTDPVIAAIQPSPGVTLTLPGSNDTLVSRASVDTLTNKTITAAASASTIDDGTGSGPFKIGFRGVPLNPQNTNYTLVGSDAGKGIYSKNSGAQTITVNPNGTTPIDVDSVIGIINRGTSTITVAGGAGVTLELAGPGSVGNRTVAAGGILWLWQVETDVWMCTGVGIG